MKKHKNQTMSNNHQRAIYNILQEKTVAYNPGIAKALGSVKAGILLAQLLYWQGKGRNKEWTYKTIEEMYEETALSRKEQENAIAICKRKGVLMVIRKGIPPRRHFNVNIEKLIELIGQLPKSDKSICSNKEKRTSPNVPHITYSTNQRDTTNTHSLHRAEEYKILKEKTEELGDIFSIKPKRKVI
jgi:hypothetical protein